MLTHFLGFAGLRRSRQRTFDGPPALQTSDQRAVCEIQSRRPFSDGVCFIAERQPPIASRVLPIHRGEHPPAVVGGVRPVVVFPVDFVIRTRPWPHVREEVLEGLPPRVADRDAATPVVLEWDGVRVVAAILHALPNSVLGGFGLAVRQQTLRCHFPVQAPATATGARSQVTAIDHALGAAGTLAQPAGVPVLSIQGSRHHDPTAIVPTDQVVQMRFHARVTSQTSTTARPAVSEFLSWDDLFTSAVTPTPPSRAAGVRIVGTCDYQPPSEALSEQINSSHCRAQCTCERLKGVAK
jgi:hypothetical protein